MRTRKQLIKENRELKETIAVLTNVKALKSLNEAFEDLRKGRYTVE